MASSISYKQKRALIIGINAYSTKALLYCIKDARDFYDTLCEINFLVKPPAEDCKLSELYGSVDRFAATIDEGDLVIFYFAGHGKQNNNENYLIPSDYSFNDGESGHDSITTNAMRFTYVMDTIRKKKPHASIYILDCCRENIEPKRKYSRIGFSDITEPEQTLIIFACGPGKYALDQTKNGTNGIFMENLLKHITTPNQDIEQIMQMASLGVSKETNNCQVPHRRTSLANHIFLNTRDDMSTDMKMKSSKILDADRKKILSKSKKTISHPKNLNFLNINRNSSRCGSSDRTLSSRSQARDTEFHQTFTTNSKASSSSNKSTFDKSQVCSIPKVNETLSDKSGFFKMLDSAESKNIETCEDEIHSQISDVSDFEMNLESDDEKGETFPNFSDKKSTSTSTTSPKQPSTEQKPSILKLFICTLFKKHVLEIAIATKIKDLTNILWCQIKFDEEAYKEDSHILLLFNHRLHLFSINDSDELVSTFLSLTPPTSPTSTSDAIDFYVYGFPKNQISSVYCFNNDYNSIFANDLSWCPSYYEQYKQVERSQSIFLCSLYALSLYFKPENQDLKGLRQAMEGQFFLHLRKYLFPPAIMALKHAINGFIFYFEKSILMDGFIQLLSKFCNPAEYDLKEILDYIPLFICWILDECDINTIESDYFQTVCLTSLKDSLPIYFENPVTTSESNHKILLLEDYKTVKNPIQLKFHPDIRSLTRYLLKLDKTPVKPICKFDYYIIYHPSSQCESELNKLIFWSDFEIKQLYKTIAQRVEYRPFSIITRNRITADVKNQLVLLEEDRTVALIFSKTASRHTGQVSRDVNHFFEIYNPLKLEINKRCLKTTSDSFANADNGFVDPRLPLHLNHGLCIDSLLDIKNSTTTPARQVTVILLDRSRSMSDYRIHCEDQKRELTHIDMCKVMLGKLNDTFTSLNETHAFGLIEFARECKTVCQITQSREQFEKALCSDVYSGDRGWTAMYDAIFEAARQIKTFIDSPIRADQNCQKLIICLSDGINNHGKTVIERLRACLQKNKITIDFISFLKKEQVNEGQDSATVKAFHELCGNSGGYVYQDLYKRSNIALEAIFEQEAAVWLTKRSKQTYGIVEQPTRHVSVPFTEPAACQLTSNKSRQNPIQSRRILREFQATQGASSTDFWIYANIEDIAFWKIALKGPEDTPYAGQFWLLHVEFHSNYPNSAPNVRFETPIYHINISTDGRICHQILNRSWTLQTKMVDVMNNIIGLLKTPNYDDPIATERANLYRDNADRYRKEAKDFSTQYAFKDLDCLKRQHQLQDN